MPQTRCDHLWDDSIVPGWPYVCLICAVLAKPQRQSASTDKTRRIPSRDQATDAPTEPWGPHSVNDDGDAESQGLALSG